MTLKATKLQTKNSSCAMVGSAPKGSFLSSGLLDEANFEKATPVLCWGNVAATNFTVGNASMA